MARSTTGEYYGKRKGPHTMRGKKGKILCSKVVQLFSLAPVNYIRILLHLEFDEIMVQNI